MNTETVYDESEVTLTDLNDAVATLNDEVANIGPIVDELVAQQVDRVVQVMFNTENQILEHLRRQSRITDLTVCLSASIAVVALAVAIILH